MKPVRVGICGLGTVASGTINVLKRNSARINSRAGREIEIVQVASRRKRDNCDLTGISFTTDIFAVASNPEVDVLVELIGGYDVAEQLVTKALENGKHVVTANKALIAVHGTKLFEIAREHNVTISFEAGVAGGIPVLKALKEGLAANQINWLVGIINGTGNFILTEMRDKGRDFADVLREAQGLGYAEADPTFDVEGIDAAHKLTILASVAFGVPLQFDSAFTQGISDISTIDVEHAEELGYRIKHLGIARKRFDGIELRVHPTLVKEQTMIAKVDGVMNAVLVDGDAVGQTLYYGAGAGSEATASAVIADIVDVAKGFGSGVSNAISPLGFDPDDIKSCKVLPMDDVVSAYYLRILAKDSPGVLAKVASILSERGINIESVMQRESELNDGRIPMMMLTHEVEEKQIKAAIAAIEALDDIDGKVVMIRVEHFPG
ncbi:MAG: homoserine dehydrogenase [Gammaproteobacteria bacterium]|nr:MAG: homoserine dehydrogenase [Gammaproteobacteria bacterium]